MPVIYVTTGAWGTGTGTPNSAAQVDGNFHDVDQRIVGLNADMAEGKRIDHVEYTTNSMTFHYTDGTYDIIPLPIATLTLVGEWMNSTTYLRGNMVTRAWHSASFQVNVDHTTPRCRRRLIRTPRMAAATCFIRCGCRSLTPPMTR